MASSQLLSAVRQNSCLLMCVWFEETPARPKMYSGYNHMVSNRLCMYVCAWVFFFFFFTHTLESR